MKESKIATDVKPAAQVKTAHPAASVVTDVKPQKPADQKLSKKPKTSPPKSIPEANVEQPVVSVAAKAKPETASFPQKPASAQKPSTKTKTVNPKPVAEAKAEKPAVSVAEDAKPKKPRLAQKAPKKTKPVASDTVFSKAEITPTESGDLPTDSYRTNWIEKAATVLQNFLGSFGVKKK
jgi:hypothetical protein